MAKGRKTGGRTKGSKNVVTRELAAMIDGALSALGGEKWLVATAIDEPAAFLTLLGKRLPKDVRIGGGLKLKVELVPIERRRTDDPLPGAGAGSGRWPSSGAPAGGADGTTGPDRYPFRGPETLLLS